MAIQVDGYGNITQSNAKEIYTAWKRGEVELNKSQQSKCESYLTPEEMDEVQYDEKVTENRGKNAIDTDKTKDDGNAVEGASVGASVSACGGTIAAIIATIKTGKSLSVENGFVAMIVSFIVAAAASIAAMGLAFGFDGQLNDRKAHSDNAENDNQTLDTYSDGLANTMDMMNEDVKTYNEQQENLTQTVNTQAAQGADLQMQYDTAVAMGDTEGAKSLKEQMKALSEQDNSGLEDELAETGEGIEEYRSMNAEALGCAESGQTVADFLKEGKAKGAVAMTNGALCAVGAIAAGIAACVSLVPKIYVLGIPVDLIPGTTASIAWGALGAVMGTASGIFFKKGSNELECGSNGDEMQEHVNNLNDLAAQQTTYTDDTEGQFEESDEAAAESKEKAAEAAGKAVAGNKGGLANKPKDKEEKPKAATPKEEKSAPTGAAA